MFLEISVKALVSNEKGMYLVIKRANAYPGETEPRWDIPGGRLNPGETLEQTIRREVKEETGLELTSEPEIIHAQDILRVADKHTVRLTYKVNAKGEVELNTGEHTEYQWLSVADIKSLHHDMYLSPVLELFNAL